MLGLTPSEFRILYNKVLKAMEKAVPKDLRKSNDLAIRLTSTTALMWNKRSQKRARDWGLAAIALALETGYLQVYRHKLLLECPGARTVRRALRSHFSSLATARAETANSGSGMAYINSWDFTDGFSVVEDATDLAPVSLDALLRHWKLAHNKFIHGEKDPTYDFIQTLENNKLLHSSTTGCVEALASYYITELAEVCLSSFSRFSLSFSLPSDRLQEQSSPRSRVRVFCTAWA